MSRCSRPARLTTLDAPLFSFPNLLFGPTAALTIVINYKYSIEFKPHMVRGKSDRLGLRYNKLREVVV
jgi:hypothetical protein